MSLLAILRAVTGPVGDDDPAILQRVHGAKEKEAKPRWAGLAAPTLEFLAARVEFHDERAVAARRQPVTVRLLKDLVEMSAILDLDLAQDFAIETAFEDERLVRAEEQRPPAAQPEQPQRVQAGKRRRAQRHTFAPRSTLLIEGSTVSHVAFYDSTIQAGVSHQIINSQFPGTYSYVLYMSNTNYVDGSSLFIRDVYFGSTIYMEPTSCFNHASFQVVNVSALSVVIYAINGSQVRLERINMRDNTVLQMRNGGTLTSTQSVFATCTFQLSGHSSGVSTADVFRGLYIAMADGSAFNGVNVVLRDAALQVEGSPRGDVIRMQVVNSSITYSSLTRVTVPLFSLSDSVVTGRLGFYFTLMAAGSVTRFFNVSSTGDVDYENSIFQSDAAMSLDNCTTGQFAYINTSSRGVFCTHSSSQL